MGIAVSWLRYGDTFVRVDGARLFGERNRYVDWTEARPGRNHEALGPHGRRA